MPIYWDEQYTLYKIINNHSRFKNQILISDSQATKDERRRYPKPFPGYISPETGFSRAKSQFNYSEDDDEDDEESGTDQPFDTKRARDCLNESKRRLEDLKANFARSKKFNPDYKMKRHRIKINKENKSANKTLANSGEINQNQGDNVQIKKELLKHQQMKKFDSEQTINIQNDGINNQKTDINIAKAIKQKLRKNSIPKTPKPKNIKVGMVRSIWGKLVSMFQTRKSKPTPETSTSESDSDSEISFTSCGSKHSLFKNTTPDLKKFDSDENLKKVPRNVRKYQKMLLDLQNSVRKNDINKRSKFIPDSEGEVCSDSESDQSDIDDFA